MLLSIVSINLNNCKGLEKTLESIFSQSFRDIESIVIDGGSKDDSVELLKRKSHRISYWISEPDQGIYSAMNKGISVSKGKYILFLNSGDTLADRETIKNAVPFFNKEDIIFGNINIVEEGRKWTKTYPSTLKFSYFLTDTLPHPATFIKNELFTRVGTYNESNLIVSDWEFFILAINKHNCSYKHIPVIVSNFKFDGISSRKEFQEIRKMEITSALQKHFPTLLADYEEMEQSKEEVDYIKHKYNLLVNSRVQKLVQRVKKVLFY